MCCGLLHSLCRNGSLGFGGPRRCSQQVCAELPEKYREVAMEIEEIDVVTENLCVIYGCELCPHFLTSEDGTPVYCTHDCHRTDYDA